MNARRVGRSLLAVAISSTACTSTPSSHDSVVVSPKVNVVAPGASDTATLLPNQIVFSGNDAAALLSRQPGDIIVSASGSKIGFLRKVVSVRTEGTSVVVQTEDVTLPEAVADGTLNSVHDLSEPDRPTPGAKQPLDVGGAIGGHWNLTGLLLGARDSALGGQVDISVERGHVNLQPKLDISLLLRGAEVRHFHAIASGTLDAELVTKVNARGFFAKDFKASIAPIQVAEISKRFWEAIGWFPVEENVKFHLYLGCYVGFGGDATFSGGGTFSDTISAGVQFDQSGWKPVAGQDMHIGMEASFVAHADAFAKCYLQYRIDVAFYESIGPGFWVQPYVQGDIFSTPSPAHYKVRAGLEGYAGAKFSVLGLKDLAEAKFQLFDLYWPFASGVIPDANGGGAGGSGGGGGASGGPMGSGGAGGSPGSSGSGAPGGGGSPATDPCAAAKYGGIYCSESRQNGFPGGDSNYLYDCENGKTATKTPCPHGCNVAPSGTNDSCKLAPSEDPCAHVQYGGAYCGQSTQAGFVGGITNYLYDCENKATASRSFCPTGCNVAPPGHNDSCNPASCSNVTCPASSTCNAGTCSCDGDSCGTRCCPAGDFCGPNGRCCSSVSCSPGCPC